MRRFAVCVAVLLAVFGVAARAQGPDVTGQWQGTLHAPNKDLRVILKVTKDDGKLQGMMWSIDQGKQGLRASGMTLNGTTLKYAVEMIGAASRGRRTWTARRLRGRGRRA